MAPRTIMSEANKTQIGTVAFWSLLLALTTAMGRGVWLASEVHKDVQVIKAEFGRIRLLEERVIRLETKVGINHTEQQQNQAHRFQW